MLVNIESSNFNAFFYIENFNKNAGINTGTILFHIGKVKLPGKTKPNMTQINLKIISEKPLDDIQKLATFASTNFNLIDVIIIHRTGIAFPGDNILLVGVCSEKRNDAFIGLKWIIDEIKKEAIIRLIEE